MNATQRNRHAALLKAAGYEDGPALTPNSTAGEIPHGRELNFAWLAGTVMTGLTSVILMGAALYVSFLGQDTFSTAFEALKVAGGQTSQTSLNVKTDRAKPVAVARSEKEIVEASILDEEAGRAMIRKQPFVRIRATLATSATALTNNIPPYDPIALLNRNQPIAADEDFISTDIYGADVEGEVSVETVALPIDATPQNAVSDVAAAEFVRGVIEGSFDDSDFTALAYAPIDNGVRDLGIDRGGVITGIAENVTVVPKTLSAQDAGPGRSERLLTIRERSSLAEIMRKNGFTQQMITVIANALRPIPRHSDVLVPGTQLRISFGPDRRGENLVPYRLSIYRDSIHSATVARTDTGSYVLGLEPPPIEFPEEDVEEVNVNNLPTIYRSIWETARKHDVPDNITERILAMFAYDLELNKRISVGDSIEILQTPPDSEGRQELLYVGLELGSTTRQLYRFRTDDGVVDYFDSNGQTGKRFLMRRPLEGGGNLRSRFGYRRHPVYKSYRLHSGVDLAAPRGTPIYASGDGVVDRAQWVSGYGRLVQLKHVNGYETRYGHMSRIADGMAPGVRVRQGQVIGYVGTTGVSTGNHLHFEIRINDNPVDPLSIKLPRDKSLPAQYQRRFDKTIAQINDLMERDPTPLTVASAE